MLLSSVLVALVRYLYTGDLTLDQFTTLADLAADLLWAESMLGLEDTQLRTSIEDLLLGELAREGQEATIQQVLELWNLAALHDLARLMKAIYQLLDLRLEAFVLMTSSRQLIAQLGFEVRCVRCGLFLYQIAQSSCKTVGDVRL